MGQTVTRGGHTFTVVDAPVTYPDFWANFVDGWAAWELEQIATYAAGGTFVDLGAWIGPCSLWAAAHGATRLVCAEPDPVARVQLEENLAANGVEADVFAGAVTDRDGTAVLDDWNLGSSQSALTPGKGLRVPSLSVETFWSRYRLDDVALVKCDVEGAEGLLMPALANVCLAERIPLLLSLHLPILTVRPSRLLDVIPRFGAIESESGSDELSAWETVLLLP